MNIELPDNRLVKELSMLGLVFGEIKGNYVYEITELIVKRVQEIV